MIPYGYCFSCKEIKPILNPQLVTRWELGFRHKTETAYVYTRGLCECGTVIDRKGNFEAGSKPTPASPERVEQGYTMRGMDLALKSCPRCSGDVRKDTYGDRCCLQCGWQDYGSDGHEALRRVV